MDELSRRDRRHAKKEWRKDDHAQRMAWLREQRQAEPVSPVSILVVVILLGIIRSCWEMTMPSSRSVY
jgi:hypothetical protein